MTMKIFGAGLAGLIAGAIFQRAKIIEASSPQQVSHRAVLRFRSSAVGEAIGIEFRPVIVHKGIWSCERFVSPTIQLANRYSQKVIGRLADRSIWRMEPVERFIAPHNLIEQLAARCEGRIEWRTEITDLERTRGDAGTIVSTLPMPVLAKMLPELGHDAPSFSYAPIRVQRYLIKDNADVFQTIYFPDPDIALYRASITGNLLIAESMMTDAVKEDEGMICRAFGIDPQQLSPFDSAHQRFGKIAPIDDAWRRSFILRATLQHRIFSLGRFATWRNILLDDVLHDIAVIRRLLASDDYAVAKARYS